MSTKTTVTLFDDLDPTGKKQADETVSFSLDGVNYAIDLSTRNAARLRDCFTNLIPNARRVKHGKNPAAKASARSAGRHRVAPPRRNDAGAIREWARHNGHEVSDRGRIPTSVLDAFGEATAR